MKTLLKTTAVMTVLTVIIATFIVGKSAIGKEIARDGHFIAYDNGTVLDTKTNLMWAAKDNGTDIIMADAKSYCENYRGGGYINWRMPTEDELAKLHDKSRAYSSGNGTVHLTKLIHLTAIWVWTSENSVFTFFGGKTFTLPIKYLETVKNGYRALPVRSVK
jgi:hypothetical protein